MDFTNIKLLNSAFQVEFQSLLVVTLIGSGVVVAALLLSQLFRRRLSPQFFYLLWLLVLLRFVLFAAPSSPTSFLNWVPESRWSHTPSPVEPLPKNEATQFVIAPVAGEKASQMNFTESEVEPQSVSPLIEFEILSFAKLVWFIGMLIAAVFFLGKVFRASHIVSRASEVNGSLHRKFDNLRQQLGIKQKIKLRLTDELPTPAMAGFFQPTVLLPQWCEKELTSFQLDMVLIHELVHIQRRDGWIQLVTQAVTILHWFNPFVRIVGRQIESGRELSCDQRVIRFISDHRANVDTQRLYGQTILQIAEHQSANSWSKPALVGGFANNDNTLIKQRIAMLASSKFSSKINPVIALTGIASVMLLIAVGFTSAQTVSPSSTDTQEEVSQTLPSSQSMFETQSTIVAQGQVKISDNAVEVPIGSTYRLNLGYAIPEIVVEHPKLLQVTPVSPHELILTGVFLGDTNLRVKGANQPLETIPIRVTHGNQMQSHSRVEFQPKAVVNLNPGEKLGAESNEADESPWIALGVKLWEISGEKLRAFDAVDHQISNSGVADIILHSPNASSKKADMGFSFGVVANADIDSMTQVFEQQEIAKLLSQPTMVTQLSRTAEFATGVEIPRVVDVPDGQQKVDFQFVGTKIQITPVIREDETLILEINAEFSEFADDLQDVDSVHSTRMRRINTATKISVGETFMIVIDWPSGNENRDLKKAFLIKPTFIDGSAIKATLEPRPSNSVRSNPEED